MHLIGILHFLLHGLQLFIFIFQLLTFIDDLFKYLCSLLLTDRFNMNLYVFTPYVQQFNFIAYLLKFLLLVNYLAIIILAKVDADYCGVDIFRAHGTFLC